MCVFAFSFWPAVRSQLVGKRQPFFFFLSGLAIFLRCKDVENKKQAAFKVVTLNKEIQP